MWKETMKEQDLRQGDELRSCYSNPGESRHLNTNDSGDEEER